MTSPSDIERRLAEVTSAVEWPRVRDVSAGVAAAIAADRVTHREGAPQPRWRLRPVFAAAALVVVLAGVLLTSPTARHAVASLLGVAGIEVRVEPHLPTPGPPGTRENPPGAAPGLRLGEAVTLTEARRAVDFEVKLLDLRGDLERIGGGVYVDRRVPGGIVHIVYEEQPGLPEAMPKAVGAMLTQFRAPAGEPFFTKATVQSSGGVTATEVDGQFALWVTGPSHMLIPNRDGAPIRDEARLSANALLWSAVDGMTYRLESALSMEDAVALAETLR